MIIPTYRRVILSVVKHHTEKPKGDIEMKKDRLVKVEIGMARGKKLYDKRQDIAKKDQRREAEREFKVKNLY